MHEHPAAVHCHGLVIGHRGRALSGPIDATFCGNVGITGGNGCGKSTLLHSLAGVLPLLSGDAILAGESIRHAPLAAKAQLGLMGDRLPVPGSTTIRELLELVAWSRRLDHDSVDEACVAFGLNGIRNQQLGRSSLGQQRRSCLAASTLGRPPVLLLDEPGVGMDAAGLGLLVAHLQERCEQGLTSLVVSHDRALLSAIAASEYPFEDRQPVSA